MDRFSHRIQEVRILFLSLEIQKLHAKIQFKQM